MSKINKIRLSGTTYDIEDSGATKTVEVTQAQYDALVSGGTVDPNTFYVITDATAADLSQYWTSAQTQSAITNAVRGKQDTLISGTNIKTINNESILGSGNIDIQGGGGGSTYSAGTNIDITNDTISCTLPISAGTHSSQKGLVIGDSECSSSGIYSLAMGHNADATANYSFAFGSNTRAIQNCSFSFGDGGSANGMYSFRFGYGSWSTNAKHQFCAGYSLNPINEYEVIFGKYNASRRTSNTFGHSGNTMFSIGNGYDFSSTHNWHNAFEVRQNGDIYVPNTDDTSVTGDYAYSLYPMVRLQDTITATAANTTALGGMKIVKLTESEYTALVTKDESTLYVVVPDPSN